jgi:hypothetical protein
MPSRIPLGDLEQAARDPSGYRARMGGASRGGFTYGHFNVLRNAIRRFHGTHEDEVQARVYLENGLTRFRDTSKRAETMHQFNWYVEEYRSRRGWVTSETMGRIVVQLPPWVPAGLVCSGEVTRIDIVPSGGYAGWLFRNDDIADWRRERRMPLIQDTLAREMGVDTEEVMVGVYGFRQRVIEHTTYSIDEVESAYASLENLLRQLGF